MYRLIALMHDGTVVEKDVTPRKGIENDPIWWFDSLETAHRANMIVCVNLKTGHTEIIKNRWGDNGIVVPVEGWMK